MTLRRLHRLSALLLAAFIAMHLANHVAGFWGQESHRTIQQVLGSLYRHPVIEPFLLALITVQMATGLRMALPRLRHLIKRPNWQRAQIAAGLYLALFLAIHIGAVMAARFQGAETDLAFAATAFQAGGLWPLLFTAYYGLAVLALATHLAAAIAAKHPTGARLLLGAGFALSIALPLLLSGKVTPISIPPAQIAAFPLMP
ncbi:hypothetical protein ACSBLW_02455 [Thioclava sp. FR2]|uniref:hypothetical protein n=1 Tax=Thioclava sp. FR2 TaxID=3445780 RepID=UPI003EBD4315